MAQEAAPGSSAAAEDYVTRRVRGEAVTRRCWRPRRTLDFERAQLLRDQIVKLEAELKKKYGDAAPPSVLGGKPIPVSQPKGRKKGKWKRA